MRTAMRNINYRIDGILLQKKYGMLPIKVIEKELKNGLVWDTNCFEVIALNFTDNKTYVCLAIPFGIEYTLELEIQIENLLDNAVRKIMGFKD